MCLNLNQMLHSNVAQHGINVSVESGAPYIAESKDPRIGCSAHRWVGSGPKCAAVLFHNFSLRIVIYGTFLNQLWNVIEHNYE